jgi:hypothetical protein
MGGNGYYFIQAGQILFHKVSTLSPLIIASIKVFYIGLMAPFFWFLSWIRMREIEVTNGV